MLTKKAHDHYGQPKASTAAPAAIDTPIIPVYAEARTQPLSKKWRRADVTAIASATFVPEQRPAKSVANNGQKHNARGYPSAVSAVPAQQAYRSCRILPEAWACTPENSRLFSLSLSQCRHAAEDRYASRTAVWGL